MVIGAKILAEHRVGDSVSLHHPTPSDFALTGPGQWGLFFIGIGFAIVKQLVGVDIGFTPLAVRWPPPTTEVGAFFLLASGLHELISGVS